MCAVAGCRTPICRASRRERRPSVDTLAPLVEAVRTACASTSAVCIRASGSKAFYGRPATGTPLDVRGHAGIVAYEPTELVVTARCGTPLAELEATLEAGGQMLPFEPPHFGDHATLGGMLACGLSGPRRAAAGGLRDFVLGMVLLDGRGEALRFGGQVMKNVAGYDVSRLLAGSMGTLGIILEASLKTLPRPELEETLQFEMPEDKAIATLNRWAGRPLPVSASAWQAGELHVRLSGAPAAVTAAGEKLGGQRVAAADALAFWNRMREQTAEFFGPASGLAVRQPLWRLSVPSTTPAAALDAISGQRLLEWGGALRWVSSGTDATTVRETAAKAGGHATLFRASDEVRLRNGVFQPLAAASLAIHRKLKAGFDPHGIFNPGRLYAEF